MVQTKASGAPNTVLAVATASLPGMPARRQEGQECNPVGAYQLWRSQVGIEITDKNLLEWHKIRNT